MSNFPVRAYLVASTGIDGGLYHVLKAVAHELAKESRAVFIDSMIGEHLSELSQDDQTSMLVEYFERYGHLLPPDMRRVPPERFVAEFPRILHQHTLIAAHLRSQL